MNTAYSGVFHFPAIEREGYYVPSVVSLIKLLGITDRTAVAKQLIRDGAVIYEEEGEPAMRVTDIRSTIAPGRWKVTGKNPHQIILHVSDCYIPKTL